MLVMLAGVIVWQVLRLREPVYQGKPLSVWLVQYGTNHWWAGRSSELSKQAETAIRQIGTNAIPLCLKIITTRESPLKLKLMALIHKRWLARFNMLGVPSHRYMGADGLIALGAEAKPAVPALMALLNDNDSDVRNTAAIALQGLGPVASDALPALIKCLQDPDLRVQGNAVIALGTIHQQPERVVPILVEILDEPRNPHRLQSLIALRELGAQAEPAVPGLFFFLKDGDEHIRLAVTNALITIDPIAAAAAGVEPIGGWR